MKNLSRFAPLLIAAALLVPAFASAQSTPTAASRCEQTCGKPCTQASDGTYMCQLSDGTQFHFSNVQLTSSSNSICQPGQTHAANGCLERCTATNCGSGYTCNQSSGICEQTIIGQGSCTVGAPNNGGCGDGFYCTKATADGAGACILLDSRNKPIGVTYTNIGGMTGIPRGSACTSLSDNCIGALSCINQICQPDPALENGDGSLDSPCVPPGDCDGNMVCDTNSYTCQDPSTGGVSETSSGTGSSDPATPVDCTVSGSTFATSLGECQAQGGTVNGGANPGTLPGSTGAGGTGGGVIPASGSGGINTTYLGGYVNSIIGIINNLLVPLLIAVAFIVFLYGVYEYFIQGAADPDKQKEGRVFVMYGIIGFVIIVAFWSLVGIVGTTLGLQAGGGAASHGIKPPTL